jgi:flavin-dependent dehydrogenase
MNHYDVIIVGAGTAGTYFSYKLALEGLKVLVLDKDKEEDIAKRLDIIHFPTSDYETFGIPRSKKGDEEYVKEFDWSYSRSALDNYEKKNSSPTSVLHLPAFIKKIRKMAITAGAKFAFSSVVKDFHYSSAKKIDGVMLEDGKFIEAPLVVDASGVSSILREKSIDPYMENFPIGPKDKFYVILRYVKIKDGSFHNDKCLSWPYYKTWIAPQPTSEGAIIGIGESLSYEYAEKRFSFFEQKIKLPPYEVTKVEKACTPYRRPPFSLVGSHFMSIGDASALTKPFSGEGIPAAWVELDGAEKTVKEALKKGEANITNLWPINVKYQRGEGSLYAFQRALLVGAVQMSDKDNDFLFKKGIVFKSDDERGPKNIPLSLLNGLLARKISFSGLKHLLKGLMRASALEKHYKKFPLEPEGYPKWKKKAEKLWKQAGNMGDNAKA